MANAGGAFPVITNQQEAEDDLSCAICHEVYQVPKLLECTHSFCQQCLADYIGSEARFFCPLCRKEIHVPYGGVAAFRNNPYIRNEDLHKARKTFMCRQHAKKELELYCLQCDLAVCVLCMMKEHQHHDVSTISEAAENVRNSLVEDQKRIDRAVNDVMKHVSEAHEKLANLQERKCAVEKDIRRRHATLLAAADRLRDEALDSANTISKDIEARLLSDLFQIQDYLKDLKKLKTTLETVVSDGVDYEKVTVAKDMRCGSGSPDKVQQKAKLRIGTVTRPVLRCGAADEVSVVGKMADFMGQVVKLERRESLALGRKSLLLFSKKKRMSDVSSELACMSLHTHRNRSFSDCGNAQ